MNAPEVTDEDRARWAANLEAGRRGAAAAWDAWRNMGRAVHLKETA